MIDPGQRTRRIALLRPTRTPNALGEQITTWHVFARVWARVLQPRAYDQVRNGTVAGDVAFAINIAWVKGLDATWRIDLDGVLLEVASIGEPEPRAELDIVARKVVAL